MTLPELCIKRPVFTTMLILLPVTLGIFSYINMGTDLFPNVDLPIVTITTTRSGRQAIPQITETATKQIKASLSSPSGVGSVSLVGGRRRAVNVIVNARKLEAYNLSIEQVRQALANQNLELPGGRVDQNSRELILRTMGRVDNVNQFGDIIVANVAGQPIRVLDLGTVNDSYEDPRSIGR